MVAKQSPTGPIYFSSPADFRAWLEKHHASASELVVGFHKRATARPSMTWPQSVDEALSFGWIDGVRRRVDDERYTIRFTPRKPKSIWSAVNIVRMQALVADERAHPNGIAAFERRTADQSAIYAYEQRHSAELDAAMVREFRRNPLAWKFFQSKPPWYRKTAIYHIASAKRPETKAKRLRELIEHSARERPIPALARTPHKRAK